MSNRTPAKKPVADFNRLTRFTDEHGNQYRITLDMPTQKAIRDEAGFDFSFTDNLGERLQKLMTNTIAVVDVLWVACREQAGVYKLEASDFDRGLNGETIVPAVDALLYATVEQAPRAFQPIMLEGMVAVRRSRRQLNNLLRTQSTDPRLN